MKHQVLLEFEAIKSIGSDIDPVLKTISWNKLRYSYSSTSSILIPELETEDSFEVLEASNLSTTGYKIWDVPPLRCQRN